MISLEGRQAVFRNPGLDAAMLDDEPQRREHTALKFSGFSDDETNVGFETMVHDCLDGETTLIQRSDVVLRSLHPVLKASGCGGVGSHAAGHQGPSGDDALLESGTRRLLPPGE